MSTDAAPAPRALLHRFPFPLRPGLDVALSLPRDLTAEEAERLSTYLRTLAQPAAETP